MRVKLISKEGGWHFFQSSQKSAKGDFDLDEMEGLDNVTRKDPGRISQGPGPFQLGGVKLYEPV